MGNSERFIVWAVAIAAICLSTVTTLQMNDHNREFTKTMEVIGRAQDTILMAQKFYDHAHRSHSVPGTVVSTDANGIITISPEMENWEPQSGIIAFDYD